MLFRKDIERCCQHCTHSTEVDEDSIRCSKKGLMDRYAKCWQFRYDPCKRIPVKAKALDLSKFDEEDFSL